jgi:hypothetical protein
MVQGIRLHDGSVHLEGVSTTIPPPPGPTHDRDRPSWWVRARCWARHRRAYFWGFRERDRAWIEYCPSCPRLVSVVHREDVWL